MLFDRIVKLLIVRPLAKCIEPCYDASNYWINLFCCLMKMSASHQESRPSASWGQVRRLEFIDFRLRWDRTVNRRELVDFFRISTQQASADIARYIELAPANLEYNRRLKTYQATSDFCPVFAGNDAQTYLRDLSALSDGSLLAEASYLGWKPTFDVVQYPVRPVKAENLLPLVLAIRNKSEVKIKYQSMRRPTPTVRWIAPHALANDGHRWHVRAWCDENDDFRDFVISRVQEVMESRPSKTSGETDVWWNTFVDVIVVPRAGLTEGQRLAIEADFGMIDGRLVVRIRKALAFYLLRQMQLDRASDQLPAAQPLELLNRELFFDVISAAEKAPKPSATNIV